MRRVVLEIGLTTFLYYSFKKNSFIMILLLYIKKVIHFKIIY